MSEADNVDVDNPCILDFTLRDGRITRMQSYEDTHALAKAFAP